MFQTHTHTLSSANKKPKSKKNLQHLIWFLLWVILLATLLICLLYGKQQTMINATLAVICQKGSLPWII